MSDAVRRIGGGLSWTKVGMRVVGLQAHSLRNSIRLFDVSH